MPNAIYDVLFPEIRPVVPTAPVLTVRREIRNATRDFCRRSQVYRHSISMAVDAGQHTITVDVPPETILSSTKDLFFEGKCLTNGSLRLANQHFGDWASRDGMPQMVFASSSNQLTLVLPPTNAGVLTGEIVLRPSRASQSVDDWIIEEYADAIVAGTLAKLLSMGSADWYNPQDASMYSSEFETLIVDYAAQVDNDDTYKDVQVAYGGL